MAKLHIGFELKWWVKPFLACCKFAALIKLMKEKHIAKIARFIADNGLNITSR